jgi:hypothetical protein
MDARNSLMRGLASILLRSFTGMAEKRLQRKGALFMAFSSGLGLLAVIAMLQGCVGIHVSG